MDSQTQKMPLSPEAAKRELEHVESQLKRAGRFFYTVIPCAIGIGLLVISSVPTTGQEAPRAAQALGILLLLWAIGVLLGLPHPRAPRRWTADLYERKAYLEGVLAGHATERPADQQR